MDIEMRRIRAILDGLMHHIFLFLCEIKVNRYKSLSAVRNLSSETLIRNAAWRSEHSSNLIANKYTNTFSKSG